MSSANNMVIAVKGELERVLPAAHATAVQSAIPIAVSNAVQRLYLHTAHINPALTDNRRKNACNITDDNLRRSAWMHLCADLLSFDTEMIFMFP